MGKFGLFTSNSIMMMIAPYGIHILIISNAMGKPIFSHEVSQTSARGCHRLGDSGGGHAWLFYRQESANIDNITNQEFYTL